MKKLFIAVGLIIWATATTAHASRLLDKNEQSLSYIGRWLSHDYPINVHEEDKVWLSTEQIAVLLNVREEQLREHLITLIAKDLMGDDNYRWPGRLLYVDINTAILAGKTLSPQEAAQLENWYKEFTCESSLVSRYADTWETLLRYDEDSMEYGEQHQSSTPIDVQSLYREISTLKTFLLSRNQATDLFGMERGNAFSSLLGNIDAIMFTSPLYGGIEEKAANLLYFIVKDRSFSDGNKRIADILEISGRPRHQS